MARSPRKPPPNPVGPEARDAFLLHVRRWQEDLNLKDWRIHISEKPAPRSDAAVVDKVDYEARFARVRLGADLGSEIVGDESLEELACHEMLHVRLRELLVLARDPKVSDDVINSAEHSVIIALVKALTKRSNH